MIPAGKQKQLCHILAACLILAVIGASAFSKAELFHFDEWRETTFYSADTFFPVDWLIEDTTVIGKADGDSSSPQNGLCQVFLPGGVRSIVVHFAGSSPDTLKHRVTPVTTAFPLKLRI